MRIKPDHGVIEVGNIAFSPGYSAHRSQPKQCFSMIYKAYAENEGVFNELGYRRKLRMEMRFLQRAVGPRSAAHDASFIGGTLYF